MLLLAISILWCLGILAAEKLPLDSFHWLTFCTMSAVSVILLRASFQRRMLFICLLVFQLGALFRSIPVEADGGSDIQTMNDLGIPVTVSGRIGTPPEVIDRMTRFVVLTDIFSPGRNGRSQTTKGKVQVYTPAVQRYEYGDLVKVYGLLETPPEYEGFSYREYLSRQQIYSFLFSQETEVLSRGSFRPFRSSIIRFRSHAHKTLLTLFPDPEAALLSGILLGIEGGISPRMMADFQRTGTAHIIAISGFNITLIASIFIRSLRRHLGMRAGLILAASAITVYTIFVGADAAVVRAALMVGISLSAQLLGRQNNGYSALGGTLILMTIINRNILHDIGFQLSASATAGLLFYGPKFEEWFDRWIRQRIQEDTASILSPWIKEFFLLTFAAQLTTMPLTITYFHQIPIISFLANPVILPAQPPIMILGGLAVMTGMVFRPAGQFFAWITWPFLRLTTGSASFFASAAHGSFIVQGKHAAFAVGYCLLLAITTYSLSVPRIKDFLKKILLIPLSFFITAAGVGSILVWSAYMERQDRNLQIHLIPAGGSETVLIRSPGGRRVLIGCGSSPVILSEALGKQFPFFQRELDWLVLGATNRDTLAGFSGIAGQYAISNILLSPTRSSPEYRSASELFAENEIAVETMKAGDILDLHDGAVLEILSVGELGCAYLIRYGDFRLFLTHGEDTDVIHDIASNLDVRAVSAAVLPGSGSLALNPDGLLDTLNPSLVLMFLKPGSGRNTPHPLVIEALTQRTILRTDRHGWIRLTTDGRTLSVATEYDTD